MNYWMDGWRDEYRLGDGKAMAFDKNGWMDGRMDGKHEVYRQDFCLGGM